MLREYFADEAWIQTMPGMEACQFQRHVPPPKPPLRISPETLEILICLRGSLTLYRSSGQLDRLGMHGVLLLSACDPLTGVEISTPLEGICLCIHAGTASESLRTLCLLYGLPITMEQVGQLMAQQEGICLIPAHPWSQTAFSFLQQLEPNNRVNYCIMKCFELLYLLCMEQKETAPRESLQGVQTAKAMKDFLLEHLGEKLTIKDLSRQFHLSPTACKSCFHAFCGQPIHQWVANQRLEQAAQLLEHTPMSVIEIAQTVGYSGCSQFNAAFKKKFGKTPSQFRNHVCSR